MEVDMPEPKINGIEAIIMVGVAALFDIADLLATFLDALFGAGELIKFFINIAASATLWLWAIMKGVGPERMLAGSLLEFIPLANTLPMRTAMTISTIWLDWHPKETEIIESIVPKIKNPKRAISKRAREAVTAKTTQAL